MIKLMASTMQSAANKEAVQFSASFVTSLPVFDEIRETAMSFVIFVTGNSIKIANTPLNR